MLLPFFPLGRTRRILLLTLLVSANILVWCREVPDPVGGMRLTFLSVGQGDAALLELADGRAFLFDAGPGGANFDAGRRVIAPYLRQRGITRLALVLSHSHDDHTGGAMALIRLGMVDRIVAGPDVVVAGVDGIPVEFPTAGSELLRAPAGRMYVLSAGGGSPNDASLVIKLVYGDISVLLTGDAGNTIENELVSRYGVFLRSRVLKVSHHGSATATGERFLDRVAPEQAVVSAGLLNSFGHPSQVVLQRLCKHKVRVHRTDTDGALVLDSDGTVMTEVQWRP
jgi:competence protein ComEC